MKAIVCDRCRVVITEKVDDVLRLGYSSIRIGEWHHIHLCEKCRTALEKFLKGEAFPACANPTSPEPGGEEAT